MTITRDNVNRAEFEQDVENVRNSAQRVYDVERQRPSDKTARDEHQALLEAFKAKYGSLRIRPFM